MRVTLSRAVILAAALAMTMVPPAFAPAAAQETGRSGPDVSDDMPAWLVTGAPGRPIESDWIDVLQGGISGSVEGPSLQVVVLNKRDVDLRIEVEFRMPGRDPGCERTGDLAPGMSRRFACSVEKVRPKRTYPVLVRVATAANADRQIDHVRVAWRFSDRDVQAIEESILEAQQAAREARAEAEENGLR